MVGLGFSGVFILWIDTSSVGLVSFVVWSFLRFGSGPASSVSERFRFFPKNDLGLVFDGGLPYIHFGLE